MSAKNMTQLLIALLTTFAISFSGTYLLPQQEVKLGGPVSNLFRNVLPESNGTFDLGSTTPSAQWKNIYTQNITVSGTCTGCSGAASTFATTSISATYPLSWNTSTAVMSTALSTTTNNIWSGTNDFNTLTANSIGSSGDRVGSIYADLISTQWLEVSANVIDSSLKIGSSTNAVASTLVFQNTGGTGTLTYSTSDAFNLDKVLTFPGFVSSASSTISYLGTGGVASNNGRLYNAATTTFSTGLTYSGGAVTCDTASGSVFGCLSAANWTTFNDKQATISTTFPITLSGATVGFGGISTSSAPTISNLSYWTGVNTLGTVATSSAQCSGSVSCSAFTVVGSVSPTITSSALTTYDAWTHPVYGGAATTSIITITTGGLLVTASSTFNSTLDLSLATVKSIEFASFTYATSTTWTGTTTVPLGPAFVAETWQGLMCFTDVGTVNVSIYDGTNRMDLANASTTVGTFTLSTNNTFTAAEKRYVDLGTPATAPTKISCTIKKLVN